jgi:opacity protein-like surface antigen
MSGFSQRAERLAIATFSGVIFRVAVTPPRLRARTAGLAAMVFAGLFPFSAPAQPYPVPYAVVTPEPGSTPPYVVNTGGFVQPGVTAGRANRIFGNVFGLYNKSFATRAAQELNLMADAANRCDFAAYDRAFRAYVKLVDEAKANAYAADQHYSAVYAEATKYWSQSRSIANLLIYGLSLGASDPVTDLAHRLQAANVAARNANNDYTALMTYYLAPVKYPLSAIIDPVIEGKGCGETPRVGMLPGPFIKLGGELAWGGSRTGFEDIGSFNGSGVVGGLSAQLDFPFSSDIYLGLGVSALGSSISGTSSDPVTSSIRLLVPIDVIFGGTFMPSGWQWPLTLYAFAGPVTGSVNVNSSPFSASQQMNGGSVGVGGELQLSPNWSVGVKYRHFDLGNTFFSIVPGTSSLISEHGDMVTGTLSYRFPLPR